MGVTQRNLYLPGQNLSNLAVNVDDNRLGNDQTDITVNFGTTPATVTVKVGSIIEVNGNSYVIDTSDYVFQMSNATDNYITFTDNPSVAFSSASTKGTFDAQKQGYYQAGNTTRTLKWYIDQAAETYKIVDIGNYPFAHCAVTLSSSPYQNIGVADGEVLINLATKLYDTTNSYNTTTKTYTAPVSSYYRINYQSLYNHNALDSTSFIRVKVNGTTKLLSTETAYFSASIAYHTRTVIGDLYLSSGDTVNLYAQINNGRIFLYNSATNNILTICQLV